MLTTASVSVLSVATTAAFAGDAGNGIRKIAETKGGAVIINNSAEIGTDGAKTHGITAVSIDGMISVTNRGKITTTGESARGVNLSSGNNWIGDGVEASQGDNITLTNNVGGDILTSGEDADTFLIGSTTGDVTVVNHANLSTSGKKSSGIIGNSGSNLENNSHVAFVGGDISITNSGNISTTEVESSGITGWTNGGKIFVENNGTISTSRTDSFGLSTYSGSSHTRDHKVTQAGDEIGIKNTGAITTTGYRASSIDAHTHGGAIHLTITESSSITTEGDRATGISAYTGNPFDSDGNEIRDGGKVSANLDGAIITSGSESDAVQLGTYGGDIALTNRAEVVVSGDNSDGFNIGSGANGASGTVAHDGGTITITNAADVVVTGANGNGFVVFSPNNRFTFKNSAKISASDGKAIIADDAVADITNSGSLIGGAALGKNSDTLTNNGKLEGIFDFGTGDDVLNLNAGSVYKDAIFDGGDGTDSANFSGGGNLARGEFKNFETATLADGDWTLSDTVNAFKTFNMANKSTLVLNKGVLGAAQINLLAGSTLKGSGTITGGLSNNGSILLASSDTLKIEGDFHSATGSTLEFALGGGDGSTHSNLEVTGGKFTFDSSDVFNIAVDANTDLAEDISYRIATADMGVDDLSTTSDKDAVKINDSSAAFAFDRTIKNNEVWITARATISDAVTELAPELATQAKAVEEFVVDSGAGGPLAEQLNGLNEAQLVTAVAELTAPNEAAAHQSLNTTVSTANNIVDNRIAGRISGSSQRNFFTGDPAGNPDTQSAYRAGAGQTEASKVVMAYGGEGIVGSRWLDEGGYTQAWAQAFWGNTSIENSDSNQYGTSVGLDFRPDRNTLIGGSFSYSRTNADATNSSLEADTYGGMLYGAKGFDSGLAFSGVIGYFHTQNESKRQALGSTYSGDFDSNTFTLSGNISQEIELQSWLFTPNAGVRYSHATFDDYTETGGIAPLTISRSDLDSIELSAEASFTRNFYVTETTKGLFEFHFGGLYEAGDNNSTVAHRFLPTGTMLYSNSEVARLKFNVGTLVEIPFSDQISTEFAYEGTFADDYADHLLRAKFKVKF